jgi:hypothetical protein
MVILRLMVQDLPILVDSRVGKVKGKQVCIQIRATVLIIQDTVVSFIIRGEYHMRVGTQIQVSGFYHIHVSQASPNRNGDYVTSTGVDML